MTNRKRKPKSRKAKDIDIDRATEIERLAALDPINYEAARADAAERQSSRVVLDREVTRSAARLVSKPTRRRRPRPRREDYRSVAVA